MDMGDTITAEQIGETARADPDTQADKPKYRRLKPKQIAFIESYTNPDSDTYSNASKSVEKAYGYSNGSARAFGSKLLTNNNVQAAVEARMAQYGAGLDVRLSKIADIIVGRHRTEGEITHLDADGHITHTQRTALAPRPIDVLKAADMIAKLDGTYNQQRLVRDIASKEYARLARKYDPERGARKTGARGKRARPV